MTKLTPDQIDNDLMPLINNAINQTAISTYESAVRIVSDCSTVEQATEALTTLIALYKEAHK